MRGSQGGPDTEPREKDIVNMSRQMENQTGRSPLVYDSTRCRSVTDYGCDSQCLCYHDRVMY